MLLLVGLLAWPWNIALTASESAHQAARPDHGSWSARKGRTHQVGRLSKCGLIGCAVLESDDYNESEDGDAAKAIDATVLSPAPGCDDPAAALSARRMGPPCLGRPFPLALLCRIRC